MDRPTPHQSPISALVQGALVLAMMAPLAAQAQVDFARDVLPLLSNSCFECHGPDGAKRKAGLRLDEESGALAELKSGAHAVVPGNLEKSEILRRLRSTDPDEQMPPPDSGKTPLSEAQIDSLAQWIESGARWEGHWAFKAPVRDPAPAASAGWQSRGPIDRFIHARLQSAGLAPEAEADKHTLIRRVTLDLTGLPPTLAEVDAYLADDSAQAYEKVVDRLLDSPRYGEHMARIWLDAARYADTHGLHLDNERGIWPYRDWVIASFNRNQPFDEFTVEQLAGDLLPEPKLEQRVATGFNRCNVTTGEGGSIDEEYYVRYAVERVETTATVWLGLTAGCAACHDHKFDPLKQKEFYQLFSYFFSLTEKAMDGNKLLPPPSVKVATKEQVARKAELEMQREEARQAIEAVYSQLDYRDERAGETLGDLPTEERVWVDDELPEAAKPVANGEGPDAWQWAEKAKGEPVFSGEKSSLRIATGLSQHLFTAAKDPLAVGAGDTLFAYVYLDPENPPETVQLQYHDGDWEQRGYWGADKGHAPGRNNPTNLRIGDLPETGKWVRLEISANSISLAPGAKIDGMAFTQSGGKVYWDKAGIITKGRPSAEQLASQSLWEQYRQTADSPELPKEIQAVLKVKAEERNEAQLGELQRYYLRHVNPLASKRFAEPVKREADLSKQLTDLQNSVPSTLVMEDRKDPRQAHILERGEYTLKREPVQSAVPQWILPSGEDAPPNRLGLAQWLTDRRHPLTARVTVNRHWQQLFGTGLVKTAGDFGVQGEQPSHPELLDWLAVEFMESGWDVKRMLKMMVSSASYRQSSRVATDKLAADPDNRLLARGPRFRLDAEVIRDQALQLSGLMVGTIGGRSVKPYQPAGLWKPVGFGGSNTSQFKQDSGDKLYRRSMYTFWKRTSPPPSMSTFDAPDRETCQVRRARTNTPLQALVLLNDVQFVEAARKFAERVIREGGLTKEERIRFAVRSTLARDPSASELETLAEFFDEQRAEFAADKEAAQKFLATGESARDEALDSTNLAAWTMITHLLLNLSETVTRG